MGQKRKRYSSAFKFQVALEAAKEQRTLNELSSIHGVHPNQIGQWKRRLLEQGPEWFDRTGVGGAQREAAARQAELYEQIGRLKVELDWVKKSCPVRLICCGS